MEAVLLLGVADRLPRLRAWRGTLPLLGVGVVALALRSAVGILGDAVMIAQGDPGAGMLFDVWFVLGAVLLATMFRNRARPHRRRKSLRPDPRTTAGPAPAQTTTAASCTTTVE